MEQGHARRCSPIAYADPLRPGGTSIAPALARWRRRCPARAAPEALASASAIRGSSWLYQPAVRTFRVNHYGDDLSFLQAGVPAPSSRRTPRSARSIPWYHQAADTADRLDRRRAGAGWGEAVRGAVDEVVRAPIRRDADADWFAVFGRVGSRWILLRWCRPPCCRDS